MQTKSNNSSLVQKPMVAKALNLSNNDLLQKFNILSNNIAHIKNRKSINQKQEETTNICFNKSIIPANNPINLIKFKKKNENKI